MTILSTVSPAGAVGILAMLFVILAIISFFVKELAGDTVRKVLTVLLILSGGGLCIAAAFWIYSVLTGSSPALPAISASGGNFPLAMIFVPFLADTTTQPSAPIWASGVIEIMKFLLASVGGTAGLVALILAWLNRTSISTALGAAQSQDVSIQNLATRSAQQTTKINEIAHKNAAEVDPLPPPETPLVVPSPINGEQSATKQP